MKTIAGYLILYLLSLAILYFFTGELHWFLPIGMLFIGTLQSLFIWLFIDPDFEKRRQRQLVERFGKPSPDQNNPSI
ncbi:hypothetical protein [Rhizobium leguminosarum]|uniref:hypothetical protein n=1 Tax=Rhizobium leguminosarum TaxID=384 RepID=UPI00103965B0|nr:hypothetical protein [Rhizobium leguminosarum]TBZ10353.1 hypothetical protein E0H38_25500 [Rhizobium leguminosarum bv. viciae]